MKIYKNIKKIANCNAKISHLASLLEKEIDLDGLYLEGAMLISGCSEKDGHLYQNGKKLTNGSKAHKNDDYYCYQQQGYCEDSWYGRVYFKTDVPGQFVEIHFDM